MSSTTLAPSVSGELENVESLSFGITDYVVFIFMLGASATIGVYFGFFAKAKNTTEEYLQGGKKMQMLPIAVSLVASQLSGIAIMSVPAESYTYGFSYIFVVISMIIAMPVMIYIIAPVFYENNVSNCYQYLELRFNKQIRQFVTLTFIMNAFFMLPVYMFVPSLAFSQVTGFNIHIINAVVSSICVFYTMLGGIKAVVWTDVVQGVIMVGSVVTVGVLGTIKAGGLDSVIEKGYEGGRFKMDLGLDPRVRLSVWSALTAGMIMWAGHIGLNQSCVQRIVSLPSLAHAQKSLIIAGIGIMIIMGVNSFTGIVMFARYFGCDPMLAGLVSKPDKMMPFFIQDIMGHLTGMPGIFISCVFSAALSTLSATLNSLAGVVYFDYIRPFIRHTEARANATMKLVIIVMGVYCLMGGYVVQNFSSIIQTVLTISGISTGAVTGVFLLGMLYPGANGKVALTSLSFSMTVMLCIIIGAQMNFKAGLIKYEVLPNSLDQCEKSDIQIISNAIKYNLTTPSLRESEDPSIAKSPLVTGTWESNREFSIFDISFYWYKILGMILTILWAIPMSYIWKSDKIQDPKLFTPFIRKYLNLNTEREMEELPLQEKHSKENPELKIDI